jgi:hypothetical protein
VLVISQLTFQVAVDSLGSDTLRQGTDSSLNQPADKDGGTLNIVLLGDSGDGLVLPQVLSIGSAERRVCAWQNVVLLQPCYQLGLGALDRKLNLVCGCQLRPKKEVWEQNPLATGLILMSLASSFLTRLMLKLETPMARVRPWSTSCDVSSRFAQDCAVCNLPSPSPSR